MQINLLGKFFQWDGEPGARGTRQLLTQRVSGSRDPIIGRHRFLTVNDEKTVLVVSRTLK
jgi:hypothetical protein